eukprot:CAMPEP_0115882510 /NCGR_PEP_ID=MMETSP0287-20121206/29043_1 /TAXON_ID=412157 /ORGANISM="Chrysochromulina rotalis, Strain UIO044" /LENGTH=230 /DNA_ID=CAMNT_0003338593 /DNA_START=1 /DNA_END=693 /DNA_ORIENTATION=+
MVLIGLVLMMRASHGITSMHDGGVATWLLQHPPRKVSHDAELVRRQRLAQLVEMEPSELAQHVDAILASLDHSDYHVRRLAGGMLSRLEPAAVTRHVAEIAEHLSDEDALIRMQAVQALSLVQPAGALSPYASQLVECLSDVDPGVRWATVDSLSSLAPQQLAKHALAAIDTLIEKGETSLAKTAVGAWSEKLEGADPEVLQALGRVNFHVNFGGMDAALMGGMAQPQTT